jgi:signal transduction histidine kinase
MQIRTKLTWQFIIIVAIILLLASMAIYFFSTGHRKEDFYDRLRSKASNTAMLLIEFEEVDLDLLKKIEADNPVNLPKEKIVIYDYRNQVIYSTDDNNTFQNSIDLLDEIRLKEQVRLRQDEYELLGFLFAGKYDRFVVIIGAVDIFGWRKMENLRNVLLVVVSISLILLLISGWFYAGKALSPISRVVSQVDEISVASLNRRLDEGNQKDEISRLAGTFNKMLDRLETAFKSQKQFINNASHELRTPLTAITGQLEVLLLSDRTTEEYKKVIKSVLEDMRSLNNISNRLLLLAQASSKLTDLNVTPCRTDEIIWQCRDYLIKRYGNYQIDVMLDESIDDESKLTLSGDENLLKTVVINLMENGCKYSADKKVLVTMTSEPELMVISFSDQGIGIPKEDIDHIFEPFRRGHNALGIKGHGIGLSLVERIVLLHQGRITIESELNKGTTFTLCFPV